MNKNETIIEMASDVEGLKELVKVVKARPINK